MWLTDSNGNFMSNPVGVVSGTSTSWKSLEASFHQDLNGDGVISVTAAPATTAAERHGDRVLRLDQPDPGWEHVHLGIATSGPSLKQGGVACAAGSARRLDADRRRTDGQRI